MNENPLHKIIYTEPDEKMYGNNLGLIGTREVFLNRKTLAQVQR